MSIREERTIVRAGDAAKRLFDVAVSAIGLVILLPMLLMVAAAVYWSLGWPVVFVQERPGIHGKPFRILKFRTMAIDYGGSAEPLPDAVRLTKFGRFLRSTSLDELPELWNVLRGDMSLVGPRPLLMDYLPLYSDVQARRHDIRPGVTGWAQVNGRNSLTWTEKFRLDVWYVEHRSMLLDFRILLLTVVNVLKRRGISSAASVTAERFLGNGKV
jgi:lipopolysaccharide/colanic/teichoic acid biosynthesis glycosyltransferase